WTKNIEIFGVSQEADTVDLSSADRGFTVYTHWADLDAFHETNKVDGADTVTGSVYKDHFDAGQGDDWVDAGNGDNYMDGGWGDNTVVSGSGDDTTLRLPIQRPRSSIHRPAGG
ncbi:hypothetical protein J4729_24135, partial [Leisingera sp. HS039]|nr:hypothetical protein [Leisingera sp. HS039]